MGRKYNVTDGKVLLTLEDAGDNWFTVTSPADPAMITQARSIPEAFEMAADAFRAIAVSRADSHRWDVAEKVVRSQKKTPRKRRARQSLAVG